MTAVQDVFIIPDGAAGALAELELDTLKFFRICLIPFTEADMAAIRAFDEKLRKLDSLSCARDVQKVV